MTYRYMFWMICWNDTKMKVFPNKTVIWCQFSVATLWFDFILFAEGNKVITLLPALYFQSRNWQLTNFQGFYMWCTNVAYKMVLCSQSCALWLHILQQYTLSHWQIVPILTKTWQRLAELKVNNNNILRYFSHIYVCTMLLFSGDDWIWFVL